MYLTHNRPNKWHAVCCVVLVHVVVYMALYHVICIRIKNATKSAFVFDVKDVFVYDSSNYIDAQFSIVDALYQLFGHWQVSADGIRQCDRSIGWQRPLTSLIFHPSFIPLDICNTGNIEFWRTNKRASPRCDYDSRRPASISKYKFPLNGLIGLDGFMSSFGESDPCSLFQMGRLLYMCQLALHDVQLLLCCRRVGLAVLPHLAQLALEDQQLPSGEESIQERSYRNSNSSTASPSVQFGWTKYRLLGCLLFCGGFVGVCFGCWRIPTWRDYRKRRLGLLRWSLLLLSALLFHIGIGILFALYPLLRR